MRGHSFLVGASHHCCCTGLHARESTSEEADIENVNPQALTAKHGSLPSTTQQPQAAGSPIALAEAPLLAEVKPTSSSTPVALPTPTPGVSAVGKQPGVAAAAQSVLPVASASGSTANKPFISSQALSDALFGGSDEPALPIRSPRTAQGPTSPFAEASKTAAPAAAVSTGGSSKGGVEGVSTEQPRLSGLSSRGTSRAERIEEALMSSTSPFSRRLSSEEVKPVMARLSQDKPRGTSPVKEEEAQGSAAAAAQPKVQSQGVEGVRQKESGAGAARASETVGSAKHAGMLKLPCLLACVIP